LISLLREHSIALAVDNPRQVRDIAKAIGLDAKTDRIDAALIARFGQVVGPAHKPHSPMSISNGAWVQRRRQRVGLINWLT
jgi:transposase